MFGKLLSLLCRFLDDFGKLLVDFQWIFTLLAAQRQRLRLVCLNVFKNVNKLCFLNTGKGSNISVGRGISKFFNKN
jgi:hypothetical protein